MWGAVGGKRGGGEESEKARESAGKRESEGGVAHAHWSYAEVHEAGSRLSDFPILDLLGAVFQPIPEYPGEA